MILITTETTVTFINHIILLGFVFNFSQLPIDNFKGLPFFPTIHLLSETEILIRLWTLFGKNNCYN